MEITQLNINLSILLSEEHICASHIAFRYTNKTVRHCFAASIKYDIQLDQLILLSHLKPKAIFFYSLFDLELVWCTFSSWPTLAANKSWWSPGTTGWGPWSGPAGLSGSWCLSCLSCPIPSSSLSISSFQSGRSGSLDLSLECTCTL